MFEIIVNSSSNDDKNHGYLRGAIEGLVDAYAHTDFHSDYSVTSEFVVLPKEHPANVQGAGRRKREMVTIKTTAAYDLFGDGDGFQIVQSRLLDAIDASKINAARVVSSDTGSFGIQHVLFVVETEVEAGSDPRELKETMGDLLNEIIGDSDVNVLWVSWDQKQ